MPIYKYRALTANGMIVSNTIEESTKYLAIAKLKRNGLTPIAVEKALKRAKSKRSVRKNTPNIKEVLDGVDTANLLESRSRSKVSNFDRIYHTITKSNRITSRDLIIFTQNFYLLKKANFNNIHALNTIIDSTENETFRGVLEDILAGVESGESMWSTMEYYEDVFPYIYINMVKVGELSGNLTNSLEQALDYLENADAISKKLRSILIPNIVQFVLLNIMLVVGTIVAIPAIQNLYKSMGSNATLPAISIWFSEVINWIIAYWYLPVSIIAGVVSFVIWYVNTPAGKFNFHRFKYTAPIFGGLVFAIDFTRVMRALLLNLNNGMRIQDALEIAKNVSKNYVMISIMEAAINNIIVGESWIEPFERSGLASSMITEMLKIGMNTDLPQMMDKLLEYMDVDINNLLGKTLKALPQVVYAIVGVVLIFFVLVVLVPCISTYMGSWMLDSARTLLGWCALTREVYKQKILWLTPENFLLKRVYKLN